MAVHYFPPNTHTQTCVRASLLLHCVHYRQFFSIDNFKYFTSCLFLGTHRRHVWSTTHTCTALK